MKYAIIAESHEGVYSVDEECLGYIYAKSASEACIIYARQDKNIHWCDQWKCFLINGVRKIFAREIQ